MPPSEPSESNTDHEGEGPAGSMWRRWDMPATSSGNRPFHRYCAVWPYDTIHELTGKADDDIEKPPLEFCYGQVRTGLRHAPMVVLIVGIVSMMGEEQGYYWEGITPYIVRTVEILPGGIIVLLFAGFVWGALLYMLLAQTGVVKRRGYGYIILVYGGIMLFLSGAVISLYTIANAPNPHTVDPYIVFRSGLFLFLLLMGLLTYDGFVQKGEHLFSNLDTTYLIDDGDPYNEFIAELNAKVHDRIVFGDISIPTSYAFGLAIAGPVWVYTVVSSVIVGIPWSFPQFIAYLLIIVLVFGVSTIIFNFLIVSKYFGLLVSGNYTTDDGQTINLQYKPFHPDECGGFYDLGRFSTRINLILAVSGLYVIYRLYVYGLRTWNPSSFEHPIEQVSVIVFVAGPLILYLFVVLLWLYHSFWRIHTQMKKKKRQKIRQIQRREREKYESSEEGFTSDKVLEDLETDAPAWQELRQAPEWPVHRRELASIVIVDFAPAILTFFVV